MANPERARVKRCRKAINPSGRDIGRRASSPIYSTHMNPEEAKTFVRRHFEEFVNRKDLSAADRNFAADYREHGSDVPPGLESGPAGPKQYLAAASCDFRIFT
jgi:hypothetical protein